MGHGDDNLIDERAEVALKRMFERDNVPLGIASPHDLVDRAIRRLPAGPPSLAAQRLAARRQQRRVAALVLLVPILLVAVLNIWSVAGDGPQMAFMLGDGRSGPSMTLLSVQLAIKPFWNVFRLINPVLLGGGIVLVVVGVYLCWWLVRRTSARIEEELQ